MCYRILNMDIQKIQEINIQKHQRIKKVFLFSSVAILGVFNFFAQQILTTTKSSDTLVQATCLSTEVRGVSNSSDVLQEQAPFLNEDINLFAGCAGFLE